MSSPFDEAKYQALLNGLNISEVRFSGLEIISNRLDAEHYEHQYLLAEQKLLTANGKPLEILTRDIKSFGAYSLCNQIEYQESGIPFLRCQNIKDGLVDFADVLFINQDANKLLWKSEVKPGMVLLTMSGTVGNAAAAMEHWEYPINSNQDVAKITTNERIDSFYLTVFFNSHFGKLQMSRLPIGSVQQHIFLWQLAKLIIPVPSFDFQSLIKTSYLQAISLREKAKNFYRFAALINILLDFAIEAVQFAFRPRPHRFRTPVRSLECHFYRVSPGAILAYRDRQTAYQSTATI